MKKALTTLFFFNSFLVNAQNDSTINLSNNYKYTLSTNIGVLGSAILGANQLEYTKLNLQFRRRVGKFNFRFSLNHIEDYNRFYPLPYTSPDVIAINDSIITTRTKYHKKQRDDFRAGFETGIQVGNGKRIYIGSDFIVGYRKLVNYFSDYQIQYYTDSSGNQQFTPISSFNQPDIVYAHFPVNQGAIVGKYIYLGIDLSLGMEMTLSKRLNLTLQYIPEFTYNYLQKEINYNNDNVFTNYTQQYLQFNLGYVDLNLSYKFCKRTGQ